jgi:hypothetical protein
MAKGYHTSQLAQCLSGSLWQSNWVESRRPGFNSHHSTDETFSSSFFPATMLIKHANEKMYLVEVNVRGWHLELQNCNEITDHFSTVLPRGTNVHCKTVRKTLLVCEIHCKIDPQVQNSRSIFSILQLLPGRNSWRNVFHGNFVEIYNLLC